MLFRSLVDENGSLTDVAMPAEGTDAHATLLVAEYLAERLRREHAVQTGGGAASAASAREQDIADFLRAARKRYGRYWRKSAREAGAEHELAATAIARLGELRLIERAGDRVQPLPALARFALAETEIRETGKAHAATGSLLEAT